MYSNELFHHGVKGMRWGVRKQRVSEGVSKALDQSIKTGKGKPNISPAEKIANETGNAADNASKAARSASELQKMGREGKVRKTSKKLSDRELRERINRLRLEKEYRSLTASDTRTGFDKASEILSMVGSTAKVVGSVAGAAAAVYKLKQMMG